MWPKLQLKQEKPHWLKLDFDLMQESSDEGEEDDNDGRPSTDKEVVMISYWQLVILTNVDDEEDS